MLYVFSSWRWRESTTSSYQQNACSTLLVWKGKFLVWLMAKCWVSFTKGSWMLDWQYKVSFKSYLKSGKVLKNWFCFFVFLNLLDTYDRFQYFNLLWFLFMLCNPKLFYPTSPYHVQFPFYSTMLYFFLQDVKLWLQAQLIFLVLWLKNPILRVFKSKHTSNVSPVATVIFVIFVFFSAKFSWNYVEMRN